MTPQAPITGDEGADAPFPAWALNGVEAAVEPHVRQASETIYERVMETVQEYLRDNAGYNIGQQIKTANREAAYARGQLADVMSERDVLRAALQVCEAYFANLSGMTADDAQEAFDKVRAALRSAATAARQQGVGK